MVLTKNSVAHDTVPYFMERFRDAYTRSSRISAQNVLQQRTPPITIEAASSAAHWRCRDARPRDRGSDGAERSRAPPSR